MISLPLKKEEVKFDYAFEWVSGHIGLVYLKNGKIKINLGELSSYWSKLRRVP